MGIELITFIIFGLLVVVLLTGLPLAFGFGGVMVLLTLWQVGADGLFLIVTTAYSDWGNYIMLAIPLFVLMAKFLQHSGMANQMYTAMYKWVGGLPGGLAIGTIFACAIFAAMSGVSGAAAVAMGLIALPFMLSRGYDRKLAAGTIAAGGTLGILIPPSIMMVVYASLANVSVGKLFIAGIVPGILLTTIFSLQIGGLCWWKPQYGPPLPVEERVSLKEKFASLKGITLPFALIAVVLGIIYLGICTPTEAAGVGAFCAFMIALVRGKLTKKTFYGSMLETLTISVMIMWIVLGAKCFVHIYTATGASDFVGDMIGNLPINRWFIVILMQLILLFLGMFIDPIGILMITVPVFLPIIEGFGMDPIWFGILLTINLEMAYITPPFGLNLFYLKSIMPPEVTMKDLYQSVVFFVLGDMVTLAMVMIFPQLALWLPNNMN